MTHETEKEIKEKNKVYKQKKGNLKYILGAVILIYCFFFLSSFILPDKITAADSVTQIGEENVFAENRMVTLVRADYSKEQEMMEIILRFTNMNYDNVNDYYYTLTLTGASTHGITVDVVFNEDLFTVLRIKDLPKNYGEMKLLFAPKTVPENQITDEITGKIVLNKYNVSEKNIDTSKSKTDYLRERLDTVIENYKAVLDRKEKKLNELQKKVVALENENQEIQNNKSYMTDYEIKQKEQTIIENEETVVEVKEEIKVQEEKIKAIKKEIANAQEKRNKLKW